MKQYLSRPSLRTRLYTVVLGTCLFAFLCFLLLASFPGIRSRLLWLALAAGLCSALCALASLFFLKRVLSLHLQAPLFSLVRRMQGLAGADPLFPHPAASVQREEDLLQALEKMGAGLEERQRREQGEIRELMAARDAAERSKASVLAAMGHEIRTPLSAMVGMSRIALEMQPEERLRHCLQTVRSSGEYLLHLSENILDITQMEAGRLQLRLQPFHLVQLVEDTAAIMRPAATDKGLHLACRVAPELAPGYRGDALRLRQILLNLLANAIKYTASGRVELAVCAGEQGPEHRSVLHFSVHDTGMGIAAEEQERIFTAFTRIEGRAAAGQEGVGLGLAICRQLVELMGGSIRVDSVPGQGSSFHVSLALEEARVEELEEGSAELAGQGAAAATAGLPGSHILVVDDNDANRDLARMMLEKRHRVSCAEDGLQALEFLAGPEAVDCVLMDVQMPVLDGLSVTGIIRALERGTAPPYPVEAGLAERLRARLAGHRLTIVAMTAYAADEDRARYLEAGMDGSVAKPLQPEQLYRICSG